MVLVDVINISVVICTLKHYKDTKNLNLTKFIRNKYLLEVYLSLDAANPAHI